MYQKFHASRPPSPALFYRNSNSDQERVNTSLRVTPQMGGQARIQSCLLSTSAAFPGSTWLQPEQMARAPPSMSASQEFSPHWCQYQQSYGTKTKFFKIRKKVTFCVSMLQLQAFSAHTVVFSYLHVSHTYFSYFYFFHNCSFNSTLFHQLLLLSV